MGRALAAAFATLVLAGAVAPGANAATVTIGSDLTAPAERAETHPVDSTFWQTSLASGDKTIVPVTGQVKTIRLKGMIVPSSQTLAGGGDPFRLIHFQTLRPQSDGKMKVIVTSEDFQAPFTGDADQVNTYHSDFLCVKPGDRVGFANTGGYNPGAGYPDGVPFRMFANVSGSSTDRFTANAGNGDGTVFAGTRAEGEELLMQLVIGTGPDARPACGGTGGSPIGGGGSTPTTTPPATLPRQAPHLRKGSILSVAVYCHPPSRCRGRLTAAAGGVKIGSTSYSIAARDTAGVRFKFNAAGRRAFRKAHKRLRVKVTVVSGSGGAQNTDSRTILVTTRH